MKEKYIKKRVVNKKQGIKAHYSRVINVVIYGVGLVGVVSNLPQLLTIWVNKNISGVSLPSWIGFLSCSVIWFLYGVSRKDKPIFLMNGSLIITQSLIVIGIVLNQK